MIRGLRFGFNGIGDAQMEGITKFKSLLNGGLEAHIAKKKYGRAVRPQLRTHVFDGVLFFES